ncbi:MULTISPECIES: CaiB/BaiF CoA transferase family protein [Thermomonospora]|uniref:L-carnitine dehydratase/bile acid-inducible protein F n=1 Tax=Thermomonospora curvata (strain ATCC 19995 / DSM 43183 / JCM 3096 / KCTC 9072 / NBRC 15933 / NCIMB 10081 / Henssen B9) TaxID=471852 RepID=D1A7F0_THECD|nr:MULTISPECIES: CoA transferase [Thermomonospora]ACY96539.1 L-carnitine dehydratase/bile acid-inducible protein F [Thermomonospora curvata DSM 43183]PKK15353.1 MAG: CoA transferase [Thermomonospora sp. CIF 1]
MSTGPLEGITVIEFGGFIAGPFAGQLLGDYGARVIKVEPPGGDPMRRWGVLHEGRSLWWPAIARNKESVVLDLKTEKDRELARSLMVGADVVLENFAPGRMAEWGLDYASVAPDNPGLIMVHVSGFGQDGPRAHDRGFGSVAEAMGGLRALMGYPDRPPVRAGISLGDEIAAMFAVIGTLAALHERNRTGRGQEVDVGLYESVFALTESLLPDWEIGGVQRTRTGSTLPGVAPSNVYKTCDGVEILIAANADAIYQRLCQAMGRPELATDERFATHQARGRHAEELDEIIQSWVGTLDAATVEALLDDHGVPRGRIYTPADILADEQYAARKMITRLEAPGYPRPIPMPSVVPKFTRTPGTIRRPGPELGEHTEAVRREFGGDE